MRHLKEFPGFLKLAPCAMAVGALLLCAGTASASITTYAGQDDGADVGGPFPNSGSAAADFATAAGLLGLVDTITFEDLTAGFNPSITAAPGVTLSTDSTDYGDGFSGVSDTSDGNVYGFNTTPGGSNWYGFPAASATFTFSSPTASFGFWLTGVQSDFTSAITVSFNDGSDQTLNAPVNVNGGAAFFGFTDPGASISSVTITNTGNDAWGIDDVSYNGGASTPEPATMSLFALGFAGIGMLRRRAG
ncbi:MAG TPA: PEP-CTERM sorting domain-containing protein [Bryobacteraceae bacterium]|nr:PEP-CTERM sorting domain-containing protein [Bryobacteraceae bacterium]